MHLHFYENCEAFVGSSVQGTWKMGYENRLDSPREKISMKIKMRVEEKKVPQIQSEMCGCVEIRSSI